jgi:uncharacterized membrane protein YeiB
MSIPAVRDPVIDAARGLALIGILIGNLSFFAMPGGVAGEWWRQTHPGWTDWPAAMLIRAACENTFILIFSFLFGYGAARQSETAAAVSTALPGARGDRHPARAPVLGGGISCWRTP